MFQKQIFCLATNISILLLVIVGLAGCFNGGDQGPSSGYGGSGDDAAHAEGIANDDDNDRTNSGLSREDFTLLVDGGIDSGINSYPWAVALFDGDKDGVEEIYIGTIANALCLQVPMVPVLFQLFPDARPPGNWQCDMDFWNPDNWSLYYMSNLKNAVIFRGVPPTGEDGWRWERVFEPDMDQAGGFRGAIVFNDALYMLGASRKGGIVWKSVDGVTWEAASEAGVIKEHGGLNKFLRASVVYKDRLYVANSSPASSYIYHSDDPRPGNWELVNSKGFSLSGGPLIEEVYERGTSTGNNSSKTLRDAGTSLIPFYYGGGAYQIRIVAGAGKGQSRLILENFGNTVFITEPWNEIPDQTSKYEIFLADAPVNGPIYQMAVFNDKLYAAPFNYITGAELWCSDNPSPGNWERVIEGGFHKQNIEGFMTVTPFMDHLYLGTVAYPGYFDDIEDMMGCEIIRIDKDNNVDLLVGQTRYPGTDKEIKPLSGYGPGFNYLPNVYIWNGIAYNKWLYFGTFDAGGLGMDFIDELFPNGIPADLMPAIEIIMGEDRARWGGFDFWRTKNGIEWEAISLDGFENQENYGIRSFAKTPWGLLVGTANPYNGFEIWLGEKGR